MNESSKQSLLVWLAILLGGAALLLALFAAASVNQLKQMVFQNPQNSTIPEPGGDISQPSQQTPEEEFLLPEFAPEGGSIEVPAPGVEAEPRGGPDDIIAE